MPRTRTLAAALLAALALLLSACTSGEGGAQANAPDDVGDQDAQADAGNTAGETHDVALISHAPQGDTFFDIIRAGADGAAAGRNITYEYTSDGDATRQATLIQNAIDRGVDGIAVSVPSPDALNPVIRAAVDAGIPVVTYNAGGDTWADAGALAFFGQDESVAGAAAGGRLAEEGAEHVLCVIQAQGQVQLEARCDGVEEGLGGAEIERLYVEGTDMPSVQSSITAKLQQDPSISHVITLAAPIALTAVQAIDAAGTETELVTFDTNAELVGAIENGDVSWAIDQQPYMQGYLAIDALRLYLENGNVLGGGENVLTGPAFIDESNIAEVAEYARRGTR